MAVNLSARQLASSELFHHVQDALLAAGLDPSALVLEMTETALVQDPTLAAARLHQLRTLGVRLAIDDFGTGYSSLSYLRQFPVDILKIDRSFINTITDRDKVPAIVRGLLELGRTLELETIAEGIETDVQLDQLRDAALRARAGLPLRQAAPVGTRRSTPRDDGDAVAVTASSHLPAPAISRANRRGGFAPPRRVARVACPTAHKVTTNDHE